MIEIENNYPKGYRENMEWRRKLLAKASRDRLFREKIRELFHRDILFAFNAMFFTYDPRKRPYHCQPFCTYDYQDEVLLDLVHAIHNGEDFLIEKSRDMGASWMIMLTFVWFWLNPSGGSDFLCGSRIEDYVDKKGDMRTLLEKARYTVYKLPGWLRPKGFRRNLHDNFMRLRNPETGASITGESNNPNFSTGGRYAGILFDEFAKWEGSDESAWTAAGDASPCRLPVSTPFGAGGKYYVLATEGKTDKSTLHWTLHPEKSLGLYCVWPPSNQGDMRKEQLFSAVHPHEGTPMDALEAQVIVEGWEPEVELRSPWYDKESKRRSPTEIAQELDIDYLGAGNPVFDGKAGISLKYYRRLKVNPVAYWNPNSKGRGKEKPRDTEGVLVIYQKAKKGSTYIVAVDVVEGKIDGDYCVIKVLNRETKDIDATYHAQTDEMEVAWIIEEVARMYSDEEGKEWPWVAIETNGPGLATFDKCFELGVSNLFMMPRYEVAKNQVTYRKGWVTGVGSRNALVGGIREYLVERAGFIDPRCVGELGSFIRNKIGKAIAKGGCHDDEVLCFGIALQVDQIAPYTGTRSLPLSKQKGKDLRKVFFPEQFEEIKGEPSSIEERCLAQAVARQVELRNPREDAFEEAIDMFEDLWEADY